MRIDRIKARGFMKMTEVDVTLPPTGITIVSGRNGQGKSALKEAVAVAFWGRTIRGRGQSGARYWRKGQECSVEVLSADLSVERKVTARGTKSLKWQRAGASTGHPTTSKAQAQLDDHVPPFDVWRRTCVFSSHDAALFSVATDESRKQLLEHLLGIDRFDAALLRCRTDLRAALDREVTARGQLARSEAVLEEKRRRLEDAERELDLDPSAEWFAIRRATMIDMPWLRGLTAEVDLLARADGLDMEALRSRLQAQEDRMRKVGHGRCPTCEQPVDAWRLDAFKEELEGTTAELRAMKEAAQSRRLKLDGRVREIEGELSNVQRRVQALRKFIDGAEAIEEARQRSAEAAAKVREEVAELTRRAAEEAGAREAAERHAVLLRVVEQVLGLRGVRAQVLGAALGGLEEVANLHVARMFEEEISLELRPYTVKQTGGTSDAISMIIEGLADGVGYEGASDGQRRRIDIALLLGLADLADAAASRDRGTVFMDEVFDALDPEGIEAVSEILIDMAKQRSVVVISHNEALLASLRPHAEQRLHLNGHVVRVRAA